MVSESQLDRLGGEGCGEVQEVLAEPAIFGRSGAWTDQVSRVAKLDHRAGLGGRRGCHAVETPQSWNAVIVAEVASWGDTRLVAHGMGAYTAQATADGATAEVVLGVAVMSGFVVAFNRLLWRPPYSFASRRLIL